MIRGAVNAAYEPIVRLAVRGPSGQSREIEAIVDTGYNGYLTLPPALALALELPFVTSNPALLADGSEVTFDVHSATVLWDGHPQDVDAHMSDTTQPSSGCGCSTATACAWTSRTAAASLSRPRSDIRPSRPQAGRGAARSKRRITMPPTMNSSPITVDGRIVSPTNTLIRTSDRNGDR